MGEIGDSGIYINEIVSVILFILSFPIAYLLASILGDVLWYFIFLAIFWFYALCIFVYDIFSYEKDEKTSQKRADPASGFCAAARGTWLAGLI